MAIIENLDQGGECLKTGSTARRQRLWPSANELSAREMGRLGLGVGGGRRQDFELATKKTKLNE